MYTVSPFAVITDIFISVDLLGKISNLILLSMDELVSLVSAVSLLKGTQKYGSEKELEFSF